MPALYRTIGYKGFELQLFYLYAEFFRKGIHRHEACVVPCVLILSAGIAKPHYEIFDSALRCRLSACGYLIKYIG